MLIVLSILKIDFRFAQEIYCCSDDFDYFIHSETIVEDFDFDYSNQLLGSENERFNKNNKIAPIGFVGTGIFSSPFMLFGIYVDKFFNYLGLSSSIVSYKLIFYSFSSIFYLFFTLKYLKDSLNLLKIKNKSIDLILLILGVGISYYAFERFSMTHVYEGFSLTMIIYFSIKYFKTQYIKSAWLIPIFVYLGFSVKWVHYYLFFVPLIIKLIFFPNCEYKLFKERAFLFSLIISSTMFLYINKLIYGVFTINPAFVYISDTETNVKVQDLVNYSEDFVALSLDFLNRFFIILFTEEFGLFWFSPVLFISTVLIFIKLFQSFKENQGSTIGPLLLCLSFGQVFFITILWESPGSAYGFRYIYNLFPLAILIYFYYYSKYNFVYLHYFVLFLSIFSFISTLFFESTEMTQLSLGPELNSFGNMSKFTERYYLSGYLNSFMEINSYLKLFITSFLGAILLKIAVIFFGSSNLLDLLNSFGLPVGNEKFGLLIVNVESIQIHYFIVIFLLVTLLYMYFSKYIYSKNKY